MTPRWYPFLQLVLSRIREFYREPHAIFWVYGFPLILAVGLGVAFSGAEPIKPVVDVQQSSDSVRTEEIASRLRGAGFEVKVLPADECRKRLVTGKSALYLIAAGPGEPEYVYDKTRDESVRARHWVGETLLRAAAGGTEAKEEHITDPGSRYIDFLLPGLVGMNIMGGGLFGVGFVLVDMRVRKLFKRLMATPMRHSDFLLAMLSARLLFLLPEMAVLLVLARWLFGVPIYGSVPALLLAILLGASAFAGIGLLLGCRAEKLETISGLVNLVMLPQYLLCGVFFSSSRFPDSVQPFIQALPLTQLIDSLREVMLEGAGLLDIAWRLAILAAWAVVCFALALKFFRWR